MADEKSDGSVRSLLREHTASELLDKSREVITVTTKQNPVEAFKVIVDNKILSAPVYDEDSGSYVGFIDTRDLVQFVVFEAKAARDAEEQKRSPRPVAGDLGVLFEAATKMYRNPEEGITTQYLAKTNKFVPVYEDDTLEKVAELLAGTEQRVHRVPVLSRNEENKILGIISQTTINAFLYKHRDAIADVLSPTAASCGIGSSPVISVNSRSTAMDTFKLMAKYNLSGVAVVDDEERFIGNTSGSDLKLFIKDPDKNFKALNLPITDFLSVIRQAVVSEKTMTPTISVSSSDNVAKILGKLAATRVHRVFVADDESGYKPVRVVSVTDVLRHCLA